MTAAELIENLSKIEDNTVPVVALKPWRREMNELKVTRVRNGFCEGRISDGSYVAVPLEWIATAEGHIYGPDGPGIFPHQVLRVGDIVRFIHFGEASR